MKRDPAAYAFAKANRNNNGATTTGALVVAVASGGA
jgi:hypothetical protein